VRKVLVGLWIPAAINLSGVKNMGPVQVGTTVVKFVALAFIATVGLFYIKSANFTPWNVIPVYLGQRRHMSKPAPVPPYREVERGG
jgi:amino acid transporter